MRPSARLRAALVAATEDQIFFDLAGVEATYDALADELPGVRIRFAIKACPVDDVLVCLARRGAGFDAASPSEIAQALATGVAVEDVHYGNTVKSDRAIAEVYRMGVRDFATDSLEDVAGIAANAPGARVFCRLATSGQGALWGLTGKCGGSAGNAVQVLTAARAAGLVPSGLAIHVGSQQMTVRAWEDAFDHLARTLVELNAAGIHVDHVNLGGGLPALGYLDRDGTPLHPPLGEILTSIRAGMRMLQRISHAPLMFIVEPGRHLVADHGAIRAHVVRLSTRHQPDGSTSSWLYLSCGKFNGLYEMDQLCYQLVFPDHQAEQRVPAVVAGPTCDSDDTFGHGETLLLVPPTAASGDPVWVLSCGAYATSYMTQGFNGIAPLRVTALHGGVKSRAHA